MSKTFSLRNALILFSLIFSININITGAVNLDPDFVPTLENGIQPINTHAVQADGKIIIGGSFRLIKGELARNFARLNADGSLDQTFDTGIGPDSGARIIKIQPDGKILIAGLFSSYNGISQTWFARVNTDGSLDTSFLPQLNGTVNAIELQADGKILIGGGFTNINGTSRRRIARLNSDGSLDTTFDPGTGAESDITAIAVQADGKILVGGSFIFFNGQNIRYFLRLNSNGTIDTSFVTNDEPGNRVTDIEIQTDGKILVSGAFSSNGGDSRNLIARINSDGSLDTSFTADFAPSNVVSDIEIQTDGKIFAAGNFLTVGGVSRGGIVRLNTDGTVDTTFGGTGADDFVNEVEIQTNGQIVISGGFENYNGNAVLQLARINSDGSLDQTLSTRTGFTGSTGAIAIQADGKIIVGGTFQFVNNVSRRGIARLNRDGTLDETFDPGTGITGFINDIAIQADGKVIIVGNILDYDGTVRSDIARLNADGSLDTSFNAGATNSNAEIDKVLIAPDGKILVSGLFFSFGGTQSLSIARFNPDGSLDTSFTSMAQPGRISGIAIQPDGKIVIGGLFSTYANVARKDIARINADGSLDTTFDPGTGTNNIFDLELQSDGKIVIAGFINTYNGVSRRGIARINPNGTLDTSFDPGTGTLSLIRNVEIDARGKVLIGGDFTEFNGIPAGRFARLNSDGSFDNTFNIGTGSSGGILDIEIESDGDILAGGGISIFNGNLRAGLIRLKENLAGNRNFDYDGDGKADISVFRSSTATWWIRQSTNSAFIARQFGAADDKLVPADYDGDGKADVAVYRGGVWYIQQSSDGNVKIVSFGLAEDIPAVGDFDGDGRADISVYRPSQGIWYRLNSSDDSFSAAQFGLDGDKPVVGDYDGDRKSDIAVYRPSDGVWYLLQSMNGFTAVPFGISTDQPTPADFDGDGKTDIAVFRKSESIWYQLKSQAGFSAIQFGLSEDLPVPADYDGDGKADIAVWRPSDHVWYLLNSQTGFISVLFGIDGDIPTQTAFN